MPPHMRKVKPQGRLVGWKDAAKVTSPELRVVTNAEAQLYMW